MGKLQKNESGFSVVEVILVVVVIALIGTVGFLVYKNHHKTTPTTVTTTAKTSTTTPTKTTTTPASTSSTISTADGKVSIVLPNTWQIMVDSNNPNSNQIISVDKSTQICQGGQCGTVGCLDVDDTVPCTYEAEFEPKSLATDTNASWSLQVEKTTWTISQAIASRIGDLTASNTVTSNTNPINGYNAEYAVVTGGDCTSECYTDVYYFVENNGYLATFYNREKYTNVSVNPVNYDYTANESDFAKIAQSVKLNF